MQIDNQDYLFKIRKMRLFATIATLAVGLTVSLLPEIDKYLFENARYIITAVIITAYLIYNFYRLTKKYYYVQFNDDGDDLFVKFFHIRMIGRKYKAFKIPLNEVYDYEIANKNIIIAQKVGNKAGKLPPVSLNAFSEEKILKLKEMLDFYKIKK